MGSATATDGEFGRSVSLSTNGQIVAIGGPFSNSKSGLVQVYFLSSGKWVKRGEDIVGEAGDYFGWSVTLSGDGDTVAIGAPFSGCVRVYSWNVDEWEKRGQDITGEGFDFGNSVSLSKDGNTIAAAGNSRVKLFEYFAPVSIPSYFFFQILQ